MAGTDSPLPTTQLMYAGTALVTVFLTVYRIVMSLMNKQPQKLTTNKTSRLAQLIVVQSVGATACRCESPCQSIFAKVSKPLYSPSQRGNNV